MINFKSTSEMYGDCTMDFDVTTDCKTVGEFIREALARNEWGYFKIVDCPNDSMWSRSVSHSEVVRIEYKSGGELLTKLPDYIDKAELLGVRADGGYSRMDYFLFVNPKVRLEKNGGKTDLQLRAEELANKIAHVADYDFTDNEILLGTMLYQASLIKHGRVSKETYSKAVEFMDELVDTVTPLTDEEDE